MPGVGGADDAPSGDADGRNSLAHDADDLTIHAHRQRGGRRAHTADLWRQPGPVRPERSGATVRIPRSLLSNGDRTGPVRAQIS
jgi:hypothetical protein